jgi:hypothetical protein
MGTPVASWRKGRMRSSDMMILDERLREEAVFADAEYSEQYSGPEISARMFAKYQSPSRM